MNENEMKSLESRLRSWRPRRPSATLKWRLFLSPAGFGSQTARLLGWLAPVAACAWLALMNLDTGGTFSRPGPRVPLVALISSNQNYATCWPAPDEQGRNAPQPVIFKWTKVGNSTSNVGFTPLRKTTD